jgi:hypothetical protein
LGPPPARNDEPAGGEDELLRGLAEFERLTGTKPLRAFRCLREMMGDLVDRT